MRKWVFVATFGILLLSITLIRHSAAQSVFSLTQSYCNSSSAPCVLTFHNDNSRDGVNPYESTFTVSSLSTSLTQPTPQYMNTTDGMIYAQPLYIYGLSVGGTPTNVVYVATENNTVYAFNADTGSTIASVSLNDATDLGSGFTEIAVPYVDLPGSPCKLTVPEVGITSTPVLDISITPPVLWVVTKHEDVSSGGAKTYRQKLHGLFAATLAEVPHSPMILDSTWASTYAPDFNALNNDQRAALGLSTSTGVSDIWVTWASHCDMPSDGYYGYAADFTYNYGTNLAYTPNFTGIHAYNMESASGGYDGGIWNSGGAPAIDSSGNIYLTTGNGNDASPYQGSGEYGEGFLRLTQSGVQDCYFPPDYHLLNVGGLVACTNPNPSSCPSPCQPDSTGHYCQLTIPSDEDLGSGGVTLLSPTFSLNNPELVSAGKQGMFYVVFSANMGHTDAASSAGQSSTYACTTASSPTSGSIAQCFQGITEVSPFNNGNRGTPAFLNGTSGYPANYMYVVGSKDTLRAYQLQNSSGLGTFNTTPATPSSGATISYPGASPVVTWNSGQPSSIASNAVVWALDTSAAGGINSSNVPYQAGPAILYTFKAIPSSGSLGSLLWSTSSYGASNPGTPAAVKFVVPTIVNGQVFIAGGAQGYTPSVSPCGTPAVVSGVYNGQPSGCGASSMFK